jgi:hypothetical protein
MWGLMHTEMEYGNLKERDYLGDMEIGERTLL